MRRQPEARVFKDLTGRVWGVMETEALNGEEGAHGLLFISGEHRASLRRVPRCWPNCSEDELRAALTLAAVFHQNDLRAP